MFCDSKYTKCLLFTAPNVYQTSNEPVGSSLINVVFELLDLHQSKAIQQT